MNDTDREKWKRVATRIGKWKPDERCLDMNCDHYATPHSYHSAPHDIPCPDPSDPKMIVAMLEYYLKIAKIRNSQHYARAIWLSLTNNLFDLDMPISVALIDAIDALPKD